ncbi:signal peptidase I [Fusobacterium perfoetens]|uniref:signal peptidase I n=1 Tax=Fusobacterium perfoetens TaxID=852 RepID=UPI001F305568|nr:signal peptidase I [Fusobacterium perfoetens]MCF2612735.1 signal peptidase I [Fusobacterium perfoetens]
MSRENFIFNIIFYIILSLFFLYLFVKEKTLSAKIKSMIENFSENICDSLGIVEEKKRKNIASVLNGIESIITAIVLVLIIQRFYLGNFMVPTGSMEPTIMPKDRLFGNMVSYKFRAPKREEIVVFKEPIQNKVLYTKRIMGLPGENVCIKDNYLYINNNKIESRNYSPLGDLGNNTWIVPKKGDKVTIIPGGNYTEEYMRRNINVGRIQDILLQNPGEIKEAIPSLEFYVNGERTGMILDLVHDKKVIKDLMDGKTIETTLEDDYYLALGDNTNGSYDSRMWGFVKEDRIRGKAFVRFWPINKIKLLK